MTRALTLLLMLLFSALSVSAANAAAAPMDAVCDHSASGSCDCSQGPERCPDRMLVGACQSCCSAILPKPLNMNAREGTAIAAIGTPATGLVARALAPEPPPPRTA
ncbi:hypothetical protein [Sphingomonas alpina]|uniref:CopL family metal-binding regulatory protein n=1 Tax=Sphingomonas alpina TaxID=653931 RepID=A0A7H0LKW2_9SPHN|nr:hypothetical protein [Sphingomonas alpina]QNQ10315.1 hypothetical protein H3Z74_03490 [Sphingomonas alpina]